MAEFESWRSYETFADYVMRKSRYTRDPRTQAFLAAVLSTSETRRKTVSADTIFWRAQQGHGWRTERANRDEEGEAFEYEIPAPHDPPRMRPRLNAAPEGRVNPKGIPCLYIATDRETAMAEVRPWLGLAVSAGQFKTKRDLVVIDCSVLHGTTRDWYFEEPPGKEREKAVWAGIDYAFSKPVNPDDSTAEYAPTQILAEMFRDNGADGVVYKSLLGAGHNVAFFDVDAAELINCFLYEPRSIAFTFDEIAGPYFRKPHT